MMLLKYSYILLHVVVFINRQEQEMLWGMWDYISDCLFYYYGGA